MPFWSRSNIDIVDATKRRVLAIGLIAGSLILWLAGSFWLDAWSQYHQARHIESLIAENVRQASSSDQDPPLGAMSNQELTRLKDTLYDQAHPSLTGLIPFVTVRQHVHKLDQLAAAPQQQTSSPDTANTQTGNTAFESTIYGSQLRFQFEELREHLASVDKMGMQIVDATRLSQLGKSVNNASKKWINGKHNNNAITNDLTSIRSELSFIDAGAAQYIQGKANDVAAHGLRRMFIDTLLIIICLWIGVSSQRLLGHIHTQAYYDRRTGLPNRFMLEQVMDETLSTSEPSQAKTALSMIEINDLDQINDTFGKTVGDKLLKSIGERFKQNTESSSQVAAIGNNRFAIFFDDSGNPNSADEQTEKLLDTTETEFEINGVNLQPRMRAGISYSPDHGTKPDELLQKSELAMTLAAPVGANRLLRFSNKLSEKHKARIQLEIDLRTAVEEQQFSLHYQPKVCTFSGQVNSVEALVRWEHPTRGVVSPFHFISVAEQCGLIGDIGAWVLDEAIRQTVAWQRSGLDNMQVAVNVSTDQFLQDGFIQQSLETIKHHGLHENALELEITESVAMADVKQVIAGLSELRNAGIRIAIDDFGTDYSSLKVLDDLPVDVLKIDRSFVTRLDHIDYERSIVNTIVQMAKSLGLKTVAEGVETESQLQKVHKLGCDYIQGYYFSKPVAAADLEETIEVIASLDAPWVRAA